MSFNNDDYHEFMKKQYSKETKAAQARLLREKGVQQARVEASKSLEKKVETEVEPVKHVRGRFDSSKVKYLLMAKSSTYALGVDALQKAYQFTAPHPLYDYSHGKGLRIIGRCVRPLTFKENIEVRVIDYESNTGSDRLRLFNTYLDSCSGIAYKKGTTKFKIIPECKELIMIDSNFKDLYLPGDYDNLNGVELDSSHGKYYSWLTKQEVLEHLGWLTSFEDDKHLLKTYTDIVFSEKQQNNLMHFYIRQNTQHDELRALCVDGLGDSSDVIGFDNLCRIGRFVGVAPK